MNARRPNIIYICAEQQRGDTLSPLGATWMHTPHLDRLAAESAIFRQAYCPAATCVSSRNAFYTGLYPHTTGVFGFDRTSGRLHWTHRLVDAGYHTVSIGKTHLPQGGFRERIAEQSNKCALMLDGRPCEWYQTVRAAGYEPPFDLHETDPDYYDNLSAIVWPLPEELHPDIFVGDKALAWLRSRDGGEPFYLHVGFLSPHDLYDPPQRFIDLYDDETVPMPHVTEEEKQGLPRELYAGRQQDATKHHVTAIKAERATPQRIRRMRKHYYASISMIDEKVGQILDLLEKMGLRDNTVVIYTSDHGDHLFDHDLYYKGELYDTVTRIPLLIRDPRVHAPGVPRNELVSQLDVAQYILESAGVDGSDLEGISLGGTVRHGEVHPRRRLFAEEGATGLRPEPELIAMIRDATHKLVHFSGGTTGQLFDLVDDPGETRNLWTHPSARAVRDDLTSQLLDWLYRDVYRHRQLFAPAR